MARRLPLARRDRGAVSAIVGTILMVAITVLLAGVLYLIVSGFFSAPPPPPPVISFQSQGWNNGNNSASILVAQGVSQATVDGLTYTIRDTAGTQYYAGPANQQVPTGPVTVSVFYIDQDADNHVTPGDIVRVQVDPQSAADLLDGGLFQMFWDQRQIGSHAL